MKTKNKLITQILSRGTEQIIQKNTLQKKLESGKKLRIKFGIDPTSPDLHLGHTVLLRKLKQFQDAGHKIVLIIGDFTGQIGDPSGRAAARKPLSEKEVRANAKTYLTQASMVIDIKKTEVRHNSEWLAKDPALLLSLMQTASVQQILERDDFQKRLKEGREIRLIELIYPLLQGYDSVTVRADVEIGGSDQTFNLLMGRRIQRIYNQSEQDILTTPLIEGTDGSKKMSKSVGNYIALRDAPNEMFGKLMSIPDNLLPKYFELLTDIDMPKRAKPRTAKLLLARTIVEMYHGAQKAKRAEDEFISVFSKKELPKSIPTVSISGRPLNIVDILIEAKLAPSKSEARRLVAQGGVRLNDSVIINPNEKVSLHNGDILRVGKRKFVRIKI